MRIGVSKVLYDRIRALRGLDGGGEPGPWTPLNLFASSEQGFWYDASDLTTLFQDAAGTTPVTADGDPVGRMLDKSGNGNHWTQTTSSRRPTYKTSSGLHWINADGVDDSMTVATNPFTNTGSAQAVAVYAAKRDVAFGNEGAILAEFGSSADDCHEAYGGVLYTDFGSASRPSYAGFSAATGTNPYVAKFTRGTTNLTVHINGSILDSPKAASVGWSTGSPMLFRSSANLFYIGRFYGGVGVGRALTVDEATDVEAYISSLAGVTL